MKEPVIVTAFWDVGRATNCEFPRSNERYYREFAEWARIKNKVIIYTDEFSEKEIRKIRKHYNLEENTIIVVNDIFEIEKEIFDKMCEVEKNKAYIDFRYRPEAMENRAKFDFAWFMKYWCISDAVRFVEPDDVLAWFDFGFNHIDKCYINMEEFSFTWKLNREIDKIQVYSLKNIENINIIDVLQFMQDTIMGVFFLVPVSLAGVFWETIRKAMLSLLMVGCIDDDQVLVLMAYKWRPDIIEVNISEYWYLALKECGADHLSISYNTNKITFKHKIWALKYNCCHKINYLKKVKYRMDRQVDSVM